MLGIWDQNIGNYRGPYSSSFFALTSLLGGAWGLVSGAYWDTKWTYEVKCASTSIEESNSSLRIQVEAPSKSGRRSM